MIVLLNSLQQHKVLSYSNTFPTHTTPNQKPTLIDLIFSEDNQTITNMTTSAPLGKSHDKVLRFHYTVDNNS